MEKMPAILTTGSLLELPTTGNPSRRTHGTTAFAPVLARRLGKLLGRNDPAENRTGMWGGTDAKQANKADKAAQTPDRSSWRSDTQQEASTDSLPHGLSLPLPEDVLAAMGSLRPHWQESSEVPPVESGDTSPVKMSRGVHKVAATCIVPALEPLVRSIPHLDAIAATPASPLRLSEPSGLFEHDGAAVAAHPTQPALGAAETTAERKTAQLQDAGNRPPGAKTRLAEGIGASGREATVSRWSKGAIAVAKAGVNTTQVASKPAPGVSIVAEYEGIQEFAAGQVGTDRAGIGRKMVKHAGKNLGRVAPQVAPQQATPTRVATPWIGSQQTVPVRIDPEQAASTQSVLPRDPKQDAPLPTGATQVLSAPVADPQEVSARPAATQAASPQAAFAQVGDIPVGPMQAATDKAMPAQTAVTQPVYGHTAPMLVLSTQIASAKAEPMPVVTPVTPTPAVAPAQHAPILEVSQLGAPTQATHIQETAPRAASAQAGAIRVEPTRVVPTRMDPVRMVSMPEAGAQVEPLQVVSMPIATQETPMQAASARAESRPAVPGQAELTAVEHTPAAPTQVEQPTPPQAVAPAAASTPSAATQATASQSEAMPRDIAQIAATADRVVQVIPQQVTYTQSESVQVASAQGGPTPDVPSQAIAIPRTPIPAIPTQDAGISARYAAAESTAPASLQQAPTRVALTGTDAPLPVSTSEGPPQEAPINGARAQVVGTQVTVMPVDVTVGSVASATASPETSVQTETNQVAATPAGPPQQASARAGLMQEEVTQAASTRMATLQVAPTQTARQQVAGVDPRSAHAGSNRTRFTWTATDQAAAVEVGSTQGSPTLHGSTQTEPTQETPEAVGHVRVLDTMKAPVQAMPAQVAPAQGGSTQVAPIASLAAQVVSTPPAPHQAGSTPVAPTQEARMQQTVLKEGQTQVAPLQAASTQEASAQPRLMPVVRLMEAVPPAISSQQAESTRVAPVQVAPTQIAATLVAATTEATTQAVAPGLANVADAITGSERQGESTAQTEDHQLVTGDATGSTTKAAFRQTGESGRAVAEPAHEAGFSMRQSSDADEKPEFGELKHNVAGFSPVSTADAPSAYEPTTLVEAEVELSEHGPEEQWHHLAAQVREALARPAHNAARIRIKAYPETLGAVQVDVTLQGEKLVAKFTAETDGARRLIETGLPQLQRRLRAEGVVFREVAVEVSLIERAASAVAGEPNGGSFHPDAEHRGNPSFMGEAPGASLSGGNGFAGNAYQHAGNRQPATDRQPQWPAYAADLPVRSDWSVSSAQARRRSLSVGGVDLRV